MAAHGGPSNSFMKTLLMIGAGTEQVAAIQIANSMGLFVVALDRNRKAPGFRYANERIIASTMDPREALKAALEYNKKRKIDGVITIGHDVPMTVATIAKGLNLPGISINTAKLSSNKLLMKKKFRKDGVPIPWFKEVKNVKELDSVAKRRAFNIILKPVDSRGSIGVIRFSKGIDIKWAFKRAMQASPSGRIMAEEYLEGPQISTEAIVYRGKIYTLGYADRNYEFIDKYAPFIVENGGETPSKFFPKKKRILDKAFNKAIRSLGILNGTAKGDLVITKNGVKVIEISARMSGGFFSTDSIPLVTGVNFVEKAIKIALSEKLDPSELKAKYIKGAATRYLFPEPGIVRRISVANKLKTLKWVKRIGFYVNVDERLMPITDHHGHGGFVVVSAKDRLTAKKRAEKAIKYLKIETK